MGSSESNSDIELLKVKKTTKFCSDCEEYTAENENKTFAVISCEGACLRGEISRRMANVICQELSPNNTVRICQGSALSKDGGQRDLVQQADKVVFLEGCFLKCALRLFDGFSLSGDKIVLNTDNYVKYDKELFSSNEMPNNEIDTLSIGAAKEIIAKHFVDN